MEPCVSCIYLTYYIEYVWKSSLWIGLFQRATQRARMLLTDNIQRGGSCVVSTITSIVLCLCTIFPPGSCPTRVVCVNSKHPWSLPFFPLRSLHRAISSIQTPDTGHCRYPIHDKKTWHVLGKVQASREFLGVGAHASLDILKNWNFLKAAFRVLWI